MRIRFLGLAVALAALVLTTSRPAAAQGLASVAAASAVVGASATAEQATNCFVCGSFIGIQYCQSGNESGRKDCNMSLMNLCGISSESCGAKAALPVDPDGAAQYVSRGSLLGVLAWILYGSGKLGAVMTAAMTLNLLVAAFVGVMAPMIRNRLGQDPAVGSSVIITAVTDSGGFFIFLGLATIFLM